MSERWADSNWALLALGSNGYVQVSGTTPRSFSRRLAVGDVVRVTVDFQDPSSPSLLPLPLRASLSLVLLSTLG